MTRRLILPFLLLAAIAVAGCGGDDSSSEASLDASLGYLPKTAPLVVAVDTDIDGQQYKNLNGILQKFPFTGQFRNQIRQSIAQSGADYDKDVKPILGEDLVFGVADARSLVDDSVDDRYVIAFPADGGKLKSLLDKDRSQRKSGEIDGQEVYESEDGSALVVRGDTLVGASTRQDLEAAIERSEGDDKLTESEFNAPFEDLPAESAVKVYGDAQALLQADPSTAEARQVKWVDGLRKFGFTATAEKSALAVDGRVVTEGLTDQDLPLASGDQAPPVARFGDVANGQRGLGRAADWFFEVAARSDGEDYDKVKSQLGTALGGIDIDRDLIEQLNGNSSTAVQIDGTTTFRADVQDPAAMRSTLEKMGKSKGARNLRISEEGGLLKATDEGGDTFYFGMEGDTFVASQDSPSRAKAFARVDPQPVPGTRGSTVFVADGETIAKAIIQQSGQNQAASLFTGPLGQMTAWISTAPEGMRINAKLAIE